MSIPKQLKEIQDYLSNQSMKLSAKSSDGRINATLNEGEILKSIRKKFDIIVPKSRAWYDFSIKQNNNMYPVNIKVSNTDHADNLSCKLGIYYALTGVLPDFANEIGWGEFLEKLHNNLGVSKTKDYYFLIVNKADTSDIFCNTLKGISVLQANGNNLPFQCRWDKNRTIKKQSFEDFKYKILTTLGTSMKLRAEAYFIFKQLFEEYV